MHFQTCNETVNFEKPKIKLIIYEYINYLYIMEQIKREKYLSTCDNYIEYNVQDV